MSILSLDLHQLSFLALVETEGFIKPFSYEKRSDRPRHDEAIRLLAKIATAKESVEPRLDVKANQFLFHTLIEAEAFVRPSASLHAAYWPSRESAVLLLEKIAAARKFMEPHLESLVPTRRGKL